MKNKLQTVQTPFGEKAVSEFPLIDESLLKSRIHTIRGVVARKNGYWEVTYGKVPQAKSSRGLWCIWKFYSRGPP